MAVRFRSVGTVHTVMYVRDGNARDEAWLREGIESMGLDDPAFRTDGYVIAVEETSDERAGFGRLRVHAGEPTIGELTTIGVYEPWRGQGVGAHIVERLLTKSGDAGCESAYILTDEPDYPTQFGFERCQEEELPEPLVDRRTEKQSVVDDELVALRIDIEAFAMPPRFREAFKTASPAGGEPTADDDEDFGIDAETATYKYDTGR